ncbi:hypothetical protein SDC9_06629 [bioreactor metagenome]|uniref:Membrane transporter protein YfcA n=1 Tax=bioreactor metagenome TaxID=1076179 RepID=A0A644T4H8_9ZZZZ|nr:sulfite exporter TauE/SafE family protein [Desulfovibrio desulfuricans]MEA4992172.1 sulfite exporter TauE/SafE family protein [Desulfovibrio desulfuricans]
MLAALAVSSFLVGALIGATGVGGVLLIPAIMFFGGLGTHEAMATALFSFLFAGIVATASYQRYGTIDWRVTLPVVAGSFLSGYVGAYVGAYVPARGLNILLACLIIFSSLYSMLPARKGTGMAQRLSPRGNTALLFGIGLFTGFLCGMTGAGGGIISVPVMLLFSYAPLQCIATSQVLQMVISVSGSASNMSNGFISYSTVWWVTACELVGIAVGAHIAHRVPVSLLKRMVSGLCMAIGLFIAWRALG